MADYAIPYGWDSNFNEIYRRMQRIVGCSTQIEFAEYLEVRQSSISDAKRRRTIPSAWYLKLFDKDGINPDWLRTGKGPTHLRNKAGEFIPSYEEIELIDPEEEKQRYIETIIVPIFIQSNPTNYEQRLSTWRDISIPRFLYTEELIIFYYQYFDSSDKQKSIYIGVDINEKEPIHENKYLLFFEESGFELKIIDTETLDNDIYLNENLDDEHPIKISKEEFMDKVFGRVIWSINIE